MTNEDRQLGMGRPITRRDFINGVSVAVGGALAPTKAASTGAWSEQAIAADAEQYPPLRSGMRGAHPGSFEAAHAARDGRAIAPPENTGETYDLIVVGGGLSGLAAAYYYRVRAGTSARILVLDNHDDFGGHAKRNEFVYNGRTLMDTGGSAYMVAPSTWTHESRQILADLGIEKGHPTYRIENDLYRSMGYRPAVFFRGEKYGQDRLVAGGSLTNPTVDFLKDTPLPSEVQADLIRLYTARTDYLPGLTPAQKRDQLQSISYQRYLLEIVKVHADVPALLGGVWALGPETTTAWFAYFRFKPGFDGLGLARPPDSPESPEREADDFRLPAGNSDIARLIVRALIPRCLTAGSFADVETARIDYSKLDEPSSSSRIRLNSTVVRVQHTGAAPAAQFEHDSREVDVLYIRGKRAYRVRGRDVVLACNNAMVPYLCPELPEPQKAALHAAVRAVNQVTNVLVRDFKAFAALKVDYIECPSSFYWGFGLITPRSLGDLRASRDPSEPILVNFDSGANSGLLTNDTMVSELTNGKPPPSGTPVRERFRIVRAALLATPFETFERAVRSQMTRALAGSGFDPARDIVAITVNRWPHGFAMGRNVLFDRDLQEAPCLTARQRFGHIAIANSDASGIDLVQTAFDEAFRAVRELEPRRYGYYERI